MRGTRYFAYSLADHLGIADVDEILKLPLYKIQEWKAYFCIKKKNEEKEKEDAKKANNAKNAAKNGRW